MNFHVPNRVHVPGCAVKQKSALVHLQATYPVELGLVHLQVTYPVKLSLTYPVKVVQLGLMRLQAVKQKIFEPHVLVHLQVNQMSKELQLVSVLLQAVQRSSSLGGPG